MNVLDKLRNPEWWAQQCLDDLYFFCRTVLCTLEDPTNGYKDLYYPTHKRICNFVQDYAREGQVVLVLTPRHWIKSYIITVGWYIQRLLRNLTNNHREISVISNATMDNSLLFLKKIKFNLKENDLLRFLFAQYIPQNVFEDSEEWVKECIEIQGNRLELGSIEKNLISRHYMLMINDDLVSKENSGNAEQLAKVHDWWGLSHSLLHPRGVEINIGTRWNFEDNYGHIIEKFLKIPRKYGYGMPIWEYHTGRYHLLHVNCWEDPIHETGSTFPILFPEATLKELREQLGDNFAGQYENDPLKKGLNPFHTGWIRRWIPEMLPDVRYTLMLVDPSGRAKSSESSHSGITIVHLGADQKGYVEYGRRFLISDLKLAEKIIELAMIYRPDNICIEDIKFDSTKDMIELIVAEKIRRKLVDEDDLEYFKSLSFLMLELKPRGRPKPVRIKQLTSYVQSGQFLFAYHGAEELEDEMMRYPSHKDDILDSFAYVLDCLTFPKPTDVPKFAIPDKLKMTQEERLEEEWDKFKEEGWADGTPMEGFTDGDLY